MTWDGIDRRKRMSDSFKPQTAFEGYVAAKLETMDASLNSLQCHNKDTRLNKVENDVANIKGKATVFGAITGFIAGYIGKFMPWKQ